MEPRVLRNIVGGKPVETVGGKTSEIIDPVTEQVIALAPVSGAEDVEHALRTAAEAFKDWRRSTPAVRQLALLKLADAVEARADEFAAVESQNTGKPLGLTRSRGAHPHHRPAALLRRSRAAARGQGVGRVHGRPHLLDPARAGGRCAQVTPWNYPLLMAIWKIAPALAAGNTVVLKPSDTTPMSTLLLAEVAQEFFPAGVFNVVCGDRDTGRALVERKIPAMASSPARSAPAWRSRRRGHGRQARAPRARRQGPGASSSRTPTSTRPSRASRRRLLQRRPGLHRRHPRAAARGSTTPSSRSSPAAAAETKTGRPDDEDVLYGPLNNANQLTRVQGFIERLPDARRILTGGHRVGETGYFFAPTVVADLKQDDEIIQNEVFGPVITVQKFTDDDEALELGQRRRVRPRVLACGPLDHGARDACRAAPRLRLRVDQHPHPAGRGDAARRVQALGLRQGPVDVRVRGLHPGQARDVGDLAGRQVAGCGPPPC